MLTRETSLVQPVNVGKYGYTIVQIETKSICNMKCEFCPYPIREDKDGVMPDETFYNIIDSIAPDENFEYVCLSQFNEPLMDNRIYDFVAYTKSKGLPVLLVSNGLLFKSKEKIDKLVKAGPDLVKISLQTINAKMFRHARGIGSSFDEYIQWIYNYLKAAQGTSSVISVDVACNFLSLTRSAKTGIFGLDRGDPSVYKDIKDLKGDLEWFLKGWEKISGTYVFDRNRYEEFLKNLTTDYRKQEKLQIADNIAVKIKPFIYGRRIRDFYPLSVSSGCNNRLLGILASGNVVPCCLSYGENLKMGNVLNQSLAEALEQNKQLIDNIRTGNNMQSVCLKCLGAPTKRGAFLKSIKASAERFFRQVPG